MSQTWLAMDRREKFQRHFHESLGGAEMRLCRFVDADAALRRFPGSQPVAALIDELIRPLAPRTGGASRWGAM